MTETNTETGEQVEQAIGRGIQILAIVSCFSVFTIPIVIYLTGAIK